MIDRELTYSRAINEAHQIMMRKDKNVIVIGENVSSSWRGSTMGLKEEFGINRVRDTPITETSFVGMGVGAAIMGLRPIVELMNVDFGLVAMDQILNQMAKTHYMSGGTVKVPMVLRASYGAGRGSGATHSESLYSIFAHMPGIIVVLPSNPYDAKGLLINSIENNNPVIFMEHSLLSGIKGYVPEGYYTVPFGVANLIREGSDITVVATGRMVGISAKVADELKDEISVEVIDPRTIVPLDEVAILDSLKKTGRLVIIDEDYERCGFSAEVAAIAAEKGFSNLKAPISRVAQPNIPYPSNLELEKLLIPNKEILTRAIKNIMS